LLPLLIQSQSRTNGQTCVYCLLDPYHIPSTITSLHSIIDCVHLCGHFGALQELEKLPAEIGVLLASPVDLKDLGWNDPCHRKTCAKAWTGSFENHFVQMYYSLFAVEGVADNYCQRNSCPGQSGQWESDSL